MKNIAIELQGVSKHYTITNGWTPGLAAAQSTRVDVFENINLNIRQGEIFVLLGPSGCGKSTLLRIMCGLESLSQGNVNLGPGLNHRDISFVFQQFALLPWLTIEENVSLGLIARHVPEQKRKRIVTKELHQFGLNKFAHAYPRALSGGMRQRVGIARALATNPKIIFMDEPFSELDSFTADELRRELLLIWQKRRPTIILVTHLIQEALTLADRIAVLTPRPTHIESIITNPLPRPRNRRAKKFFALEDRLEAMIKP